MESVQHRELKAKTSNNDEQVEHYPGSVVLNSTNTESKYDTERKDMLKVNIV